MFRLWLACGFAISLLAACQPRTISPGEVKILTADSYDGYIMDLPYPRQTYTQLGVKLRSMMEVSTVDLPLAEGLRVRRDTFDKGGRLLRTWFETEAPSDSIRYEYEPEGQIKKVTTYYKDDSIYTQYQYDRMGMMTQVVFVRDGEMWAYNTYHNKYAKLTDLQLSDESPKTSNVREIYRFDSRGRHIKSMRLVDNVIVETHEKQYNGKGQVEQTKEMANGRIMATTEYMYGQNGLLQLKKDRIILSDEEVEVRMYEFVYAYYDED